MDPKVLLFDEPTSALDAELVREVLDVMEELAAGGMTMVVVTHELKFARKAANHVAMMSDGMLIESPTPRASSPRPLINALASSSITLHDVSLWAARDVGGGL